jgi:hypothetical protein
VCGSCRRNEGAIFGKLVIARSKVAFKGVTREMGGSTRNDASAHRHREFIGFSDSKEVNFNLMSGGAEEDEKKDYKERWK